MEITPLSSISRTEWEAFVDGSDECWLYHHPLFADLDSSDSKSFVVMDHGRVCGGCLLYVNRSGFGKVLGGRFGAAGLALRSDLARPAYPLVLAYLYDVAEKTGSHAIQMVLPVLAPGYANAEYLDTHLYQLGFNSTLRWGLLTHYTPSYTTVIDLHLASEDIRAGFSTLVRRKCTRAARVAGEHEFLQSDVTDEAWSAFLRNHESTMRRGGDSPLGGALLGRLRGLFAHGFAALVNVRSGADVVASLLVLTYKRTAFYFASGLRDDAYRDGLSAYVHWIAIQELRRRGYERYEIGQFFPELRNVKLRQLGEFKRMFGGSKRPMLAGELVTNELRFVALDVLPAYGRKWAKAMLVSWRKETS